MSYQCLWVGDKKKDRSIQSFSGVVEWTKTYLCHDLQDHGIDYYGITTWHWLLRDNGIGLLRDYYTKWISFLKGFRSKNFSEHIFQRYLFSLLSFDSVHSKIFKGGIVKRWFIAPLQNLCEHTATQRFKAQLRKLHGSGYTSCLLFNVGESLTTHNERSDKASRPAMIPCQHNLTPWT